MKCILLIIMVAAIAACSSAEDRKAAYLQKAADLQAKGDYGKARLELKNAMQIDPKDARTVYRLGELEEQLQNWRAAAGAYQQVTELDTTRVDAKLKLGRLFLLGGAADRAEPLINEVLKAQPDNVDALVLRAGLESRRNQLQDAERDVRAALDKDPHHIDGIILAASLAMRAGKGDEAERLLKQGIQAHPEHTGLHAVLATVYAQLGRVDDGAAQLKEIIGLEPKVAGHRIRLAEFYAANHRNDDAERVLRDGLQQDPKQPDLRRALVGFQVKQGKQDAALATLVQYIKESPDDYALRFQLAELHLAMGKAKEAGETYEAVIAAAGTKPDGLKARDQLARLLMVEGQGERAATLLAEVLKENPNDNDALILRATQALSRQDAISAIADLRTVLRDQPNSAPALRELARAHMLNGEPDLALEAMQKAAAAAPADHNVQVQLASLLAEQGQLGPAQQQLEAVLKEDPKYFAALETLFKVQMTGRNYDQAAQLAQRIQALQPGQGEYDLGLVLEAQKKSDEAAAHFEAALKAVPGAAEPLSALTKIRLAQGKADVAEQFMRQEIKRKGDNVVAQNLLGEVLLVEKKYDAALAPLQEAERINPHLATPYRNQALALLVKGDKAGAAAILEKGIAATDHDPNLVFTLATYRENSGQSDQAIALYDEALKARPKEAMFINNLAMLLANYRHDKPDLDRAVELGERLKDKGNPAYLDTLGWAYYRRGEVTAAVPVLEQAASKASDSALLSYHLGMAYYQKGDHDSARRYLEKAAAAKAPYQGLDEAKATLAKLEKS